MANPAHVQIEMKQMDHHQSEEEEKNKKDKANEDEGCAEESMFLADLLCILGLNVGKKCVGSTIVVAHR